MLSLTRFVAAHGLLKREKLSDLMRDMILQNVTLSLTKSRLKSEYNNMSAGEHITVEHHKEKYLCFPGDLISRSLWIHGEFDLHKLQKALNYLQKFGLATELLVDVGANLGSISIPAISRHLFERAICVEANPKIHALLHENISRNGLSSLIEVHLAAAADKPGLSYEMSAKPSNLGAGQVELSSDSSSFVQSISLDSLLLDSKPSLIFMDIEGFEGPALEGSSRLLASKVPFAFEFNPHLLELHTTKERFVSLFKDYHYVASLNDPLNRVYEASKIGKFWDAYRRNDAVTDLIVF